MNVELLANALVLDVGPSSGQCKPPAPTNAKLVAPDGIDPATITEEVQPVPPDNTPTHAATRSSNAQPLKRFEQTLQEQIQAQGPQTEDAAMQTQGPPETAEMPDQPQSSQSQPNSDEAPNELYFVPLTVTSEMVDAPEKVLTVESPQDLVQLLTNSGLPRSVNLTISQSGRISGVQTPTMPESHPDKLSEPIIQQDQIETKHVMSVQQNTLHVPGAPPTEGQQISRETAHNAVLTHEQPTTLDEKTDTTVNALLVDRAKPAMPVAKSGEVVEQIIAKAEPGLQDIPDVAKERSSDSRPDKQVLSPKISSNEFGKTDSESDAPSKVRTDSESPRGAGAESGLAEKILPGGSAIKSLNAFLPAVHAESTADQAKSGNNKNSNAGVVVESQRAIPAANIEISAPSQPSAAPPPRSASNPYDGDISSAIGRQIRESITSSTVGPDKQITIRLDPPELGRVVVKFREQENQITGLLEVSKAQTRAQIQHALPEITRDLQGLGVQVRRFEVVMTDAQEHRTLNGQSAMAQQDGWGAQQGLASGDPHAHGQSLNTLPFESTAYMEPTQTSQTHITDQSIDMFA